MAQEDIGLVPYKDISELKKELEAMKVKKDVSMKEVYDAVQKLAQIIENMLEVFGGAAENRKLEEKSYEADAKRHEMIISKLDRVADHNKTIAEAMVKVVEMIKEKIVAFPKERKESPMKPKEEEETFIRPKPEPMPFAEPRMFPNPQTFMKPQQEWQPRQESMIKPQQEWQPRQESMIPRSQPYMAPPIPQPPMNPIGMTRPIAPPPIAPSMHDFGSEMPPMQPEPSLDLDFPDDPFASESPKKKGIFGLFKK